MIIDKYALRRQLCRRRKQLTSSVAAHLSTQIRQHLQRSGLFLRYRRIAIYWPMGNEVDLLPLWRCSPSPAISWFFPVLHSRHRQLGFALAHSHTQWRNNRFHIPEPVSPSRKNGHALDLVLMPLVGFDQAGYRLGMGGGYYDTTFAFRRRRLLWRYPKLIGVAYECQRIEQIPHEKWDIRLDAVVTEKGLTWFGRQSQPPL